MTNEPTFLIFGRLLAALRQLYFPSRLVSTIVTAYIVFIDLAC